MEKVPSVPNDFRNIFAHAEDMLVSEPIKNEDGSTTYMIGNSVRSHTVAAINPVLADQIKQDESFVEPDSFINYLNLYKTSSTINRASLNANKITAVMDYHAPRDESGITKPNRCKHIVTLSCPYDLDFAAWKKRLSIPMNQQELAEFIEDMLHTIASPSAGDLMEAITDMKVERGVKFRSGLNDRDGTVKLTYEEQDGDGQGGSVTLPREITVVCPVFQGGDKVTLTVRLRYAISRGSVAFTLAVPGLDQLERQEFRNIGANISGSTETPIFYTS